jgi:hypothetical protein
MHQIAGSVPASSCQRKGMRCHDDTGTKLQVKSQVIRQVDRAPKGPIIHVKIVFLMHALAKLLRF